MSVERNITIPEFDPPTSGPKKLDWAALPEAARKRMVETMRAAVESAMSEKVPGPNVDISKLHGAIRHLWALVDAASEQVRNALDPTDPYGPTLSRILPLLSNKAIEVGEVPLVDPMGPSRMVPHSVKFYVGLRQLVAPLEGHYQDMDTSII